MRQHYVLGIIVYSDPAPRDLQVASESPKHRDLLWFHNFHCVFGVDADIILTLLVFQNVGFWQFLEVQKGSESSRKLVGVISTYPGTSPTLWCRVMAKSPGGMRLPSTVATEIQWSIICCKKKVTAVSLALKVANQSSQYCRLPEPV